MRKRLWTLTPLLAILLIIGLVGCDNNPVAPAEDDPVLPTIPSEFSEMEAIGFSGSNPATLEDARESMGYAIGNISIPLGDLFMSSVDTDVTAFDDLFTYMGDITNNTYDDSADAAINIDPSTLTGDVDMAMDETFGNAYFKGSLSATTTHSNLIELITERDETDTFDYLFPTLAMGYDTSIEDFTTDLTNGAFNIVMNLSGLDIKVTDADGEDWSTGDPNGIDTEYFRIFADIELTASGTGIDITQPADTGLDDVDGNDIYTMEITGGTIDFDINLDLKFGFVLSSTDASVNGCKVVGTIDLEDALADFDLTGIDMYDFDNLLNSLTDFLNQISAPKIKYTVFDTNNTYLFEETVNVSDELNDLLTF